MADRTLAPARILILAAVLTAPAPAPAQGPTAAPGGPPLDRQPYAIRALVDVDPGARLDAIAVDRLLAAWHDLVHRFVGAPWNLGIERCPGPLVGVDPDRLSPEALRPLAASADAVWVLRIERGRPFGLTVAARSFDPVTGTLTATRRQELPLLADAPRTLLALSLDLFTPRAEITTSAGGELTLTVQGGSLMATDKAGARVAPGATFVPYRLFLKPDGSTRLVQPIAWTYLTVRSWDAPQARCTLVSSLRDPLSRRVVGSSRLVALGVRPVDRPIPLRFETRGPEPRAASGFRVTVREPDSPRARLVGTTDRAGRIAIPMGLAAKGPVLVRIVAAGIEPLAEFPVLPGESETERVVRVDLRPAAAALQVRLDALRDEVVDQVALRARLRSFLEARLQGEAWDEIRNLLGEYRKLPPAEGFRKRLAALRAEAETTQTETRAIVLTPTVQARLDETESLVTNYLDDAVFEPFDRALADATAPAPAPRPAVPKAAAAPAPAPAGQPAPAAPAPAPAQPAATSAPGATPF